MESQFIKQPCPTCGQPRRRVNGAWLREQRERAGLTLAALARQLGVSPQYLTQIERGERPANERVVADYAKINVH